MAARHRGQGSVSTAYGGAAKVPAVKPYFWAVKLLTTAMGEAMSDFVVLDVNKYLGVVLGFLVFVAAITWQFRAPRYETWPYWTAVSMVAVFGTMAADVMHVVLGLPYMVSAVFYATCLVVTFVAWYRSEGTLDIHSIVTRRREVFYWLAVIFTFAMGTALGDLFATTFALGYLPSALVFIALICVPLVAWRLGASPVLTFWAAYILTRPIGASFADFFGMPKDVSGMGFGHGAVSLVTLILVLAFFVSISRSGIDQPEAAPAAAAAGRPAGYGQPGRGQPRYGRPQHAGPQYGEAQFGEAQFGEAQFGEAQYAYGQAQYGYAQAQYASAYGGPGQDPARYGRPGYADPRYGEGPYGQPAPGRPQPGRPRPGDLRRGPPPRYGQPQGRQPRYGEPRPGRPRHDQPQYDQPQYDQPQYDQPQYDQPRYAEPRYGQPRYERPRYDDSRYGQERYGQERYDPGYGQERYHQPRYGGPGYDDPGYGQQRYDQSRHDPRYDRERQDQERYGNPRDPGPRQGSPRYGNPRYGERRDHRSP